MSADRGTRNVEPGLAFVALGSNLGDSVRIVRLAMDQLQAFSSAPLRRSSLWRSTPEHCPPGALDFINAVVGLQPLTGETPESLLNKLQGLEREFGRQPGKVRNESRLLDLDLIAFGREERNTPRLTLPHPRAHLRGFVLAPLAEIAPDVNLPGQPSGAAALLAAVTAPGRLERLV